MNFEEIREIGEDSHYSIKSESENSQFLYDSLDYIHRFDMIELKRSMRQQVIEELRIFRFTLY